MDVTSAELLPAKLNFMINREYQNWYIHFDGGSFVPSPLEKQLNYPFHFFILKIFIAIICIFLCWRIKNKKRKNEKCQESNHVRARVLFKNLSLVNSAAEVVLYLSIRTHTCQALSY